LHQSQAVIGKGQQMCFEAAGGIPQGIKRLPDLILGGPCISLALCHGLRLALHVTKQQQEVGKVVD
jgi:hypothetical protein